MSNSAINKRHQELDPITFIEKLEVAERHVVDSRKVRKHCTSLLKQIQSAIRLYGDSQNCTKVEGRESLSDLIDSLDTTIGALETILQTETESTNVLVCLIGKELKASTNLEIFKTTQTMDSHSSELCIEGVRNEED